MDSRDFNTLKNDFLQSDGKRGLELVDSFVSIGGEEVVQFLIQCLVSSKVEVRNRAALALRGIGDQNAIKPLIEGIINPIDPKKCGTLVYALQSHDCSKYFIDIFRILFYSNYECKMGAHTILNEQKFLFTNDDLRAVKQMWEECIIYPEKCPSFENVKEDVQNDVDSFLSYLTET